MPQENILIKHDKKGRFIKGDIALILHNKTKKQRIAVGQATKKRLLKNGFLFNKEMQDKATQSRKKLGIGFQKRNILGKKNKGREIGRKWREKLRQSHKGLFVGEKHPNWKGGITPINDTVRHSIEFRLWREAVFARDNWTCQKCKEKGGELHPHHIQNFAQYPELRFAIDNGITFCKKCHKLFHKIFGQRNNTKKQLEEFIKILKQYG